MNLESWWWYLWWRWHTKDEYEELYSLQGLFLHSFRHVFALSQCSPSFILWHLSSLIVLKTIRIQYFVLLSSCNILNRVLIYLLYNSCALSSLPKNQYYHHPHPSSFFSYFSISSSPLSPPPRPPLSPSSLPHHPPRHHHINVTLRLLQLKTLNHYWRPCMLIWTSYSPSKGVKPPPQMKWQ